jgi:hypothetical protein
VSAARRNTASVEGNCGTSSLEREADLLNCWRNSSLEPKFHYRVHKSLSLISILTHLSTADTIATQFTYYLL